MKEEKDNNLDDQSNNAVLKRALEFYDTSKRADEENRGRYQSDVRFSRLGEQWPSDVKRKRELEGRPCLTFNKAPSFIRQVVNDSRQNKPSISILPVGADSDKATAQILEGIVRNIEVQSCADVAYDTAIENSCSGGFGYIRVKLDYPHNDMFDLDICIDSVPNPLVVYRDINSKAGDSSDWNKALVTDWITKEEFEAKYKKTEAVDWEHDFQSLPDWITDDHVMIAEYWEREEEDEMIYQLSNGMIVSEKELDEARDILDASGIQVTNKRMSKRYDVTQYIMSGTEILEKNEWPGQYIPIIPVYGDEVNDDGVRQFFSLHHHARGAMESYNYWRTSAVEKVALDTKSPWIGPAGFAETDIEKWLTANTQNHPFIEYDGVQPPFRTPAGGVPAGDLQLALSASDDMKAIIGIYDASLGARSNETSGKAILARQREGDVATFHFIDNMSRAIRHLGKIVIDLIPSVYTKERIVRILHEDGTPESVQVNQKFIQDGIEKVYDLTTGKYDVVVKSGPSFTSRREEAASQMMQLIQSFPQAAPVIGDLIAKNLEWPGADEIAERMKALLPPAAQANAIPPEIQQQIQAVQQQVQQGQEAYAIMQKENESLKLQLQNKTGDLQIKAAELQLKERELLLHEKEVAAELHIKAAELSVRAMMPQAEETPLN